MTDMTAEELLSALKKCDEVIFNLEGVRHRSLNPYWIGKNPTLDRLNRDIDVQKEQKKLLLNTFMQQQQAKWEAEQWRPIETAPNDGSYYLLSQGKEAYIGRYLTEKIIEDEGIYDDTANQSLGAGWYRTAYSDFYDTYYVLCDPAHCRPLPALPESETQND